jgi:nucleotide sugar dehydrogenase
MSNETMNPEQEQQYPTDFFPTDPEYGKGEKPLVGIVGHGFVGKAVERSFVPEVDRFLVDPNYGTTIDQLVEQEPSLTFVCTPTPVGGNGRVDAAITVDAILKLIRKTKSAVVLKSTVTPDVIDKICRALAPEQAEYRFVYAPEFLTEKNADDEYCNPKFMVFGGAPQSCNQLIEFMHFNTFVRLPKNAEEDGGIHIVTPTEASFIKYAINSFLAMKVTFFNNLYDACKDEMYTTSATVVSRIVSSEPRIGPTHWRVPGIDGKKGFGGACLPKDVSAFTAYTDKMKILESVLEINNKYREEYGLDDREKQQNITFGKRDVEEVEENKEDAA